MTLFFIAMLIGTGALAGLAAGYMGIGGGAVLTPLCLFVYSIIGIQSGELVKVIFGTNMFLVMVFSISAVQKHHSNKKIEWRTVMVMGLPAVLGSFAGAWLASLIQSVVLEKAFAAMLFTSSVLIVLRGSAKPQGDGSDRRAMLPLKLLPALGFVTGFVGSLLGVGGGVVMIPSLILLFALRMDKVAGTSSSVIIFIGFTGMLSYMWYGRGLVDLPGWTTGYIWWSAAIPLAIGGIPMARLGAMLNSRTRQKLLRRIFGFVLLVISLKMFFF